MTQRTPLYDEHVNASGKIVDFAGWSLPIHYGSVIEEHHAVRKSAGMFDVSHMTVIDIHGQDVEAYCRYMLANDVMKLTQNNQALYSVMLNERAGIIDDLIIYRMQKQFFRMVVNAATRDKDLKWLNEHAKSFQVKLTERTDLAMIAAQGPYAREKAHQALKNYLDIQELHTLKPFHNVFSNNILVARTGYTGEDGYEILLPGEEAPKFWQCLKTQGIKPCGLGARDTLRLEAGLNLYGQDMDESNHPYESNLGWTIALNGDHDFIGRSALEKIKSDKNQKKLIGVVLQDKGVIRSHYPVRFQNQEAGSITSGTFSPTLGKSIGLARVDNHVEDFCEIGIRGKWMKAQIVKPPFVRYGKTLI